MNTSTEENYLKAIYKIAEDGNESVTTNSLASKLNTTAASVTDMLKKLSAKKLISYRKYQGVSLTEKGESGALGIIRKHRLWEMFLVQTLNFKWDEVHEVAEQLEHIQSEKLISHIDEFLGFPKSDPHGDPIPDSKGKITSLKSKVLTELAKGQQARMCGVIDHSPAFLRYLDGIGIRIGDKILIDSVSAYDLSMTVSVNRKPKIFLSSQAGKNILVTNEN